MNPSRICYIHAGTHKTASTYIQSRLERNRRLLKKQNLLYEFPARRGLKFKPLVKAMNKGKWMRWTHYLEGHRAGTASLLLSAEQFTRPLCSPERLRRLKKIVRRQGFSLHVVIFVRPQLDYMNSRYVHTLRRLYHSQSFEQYVKSFVSNPEEDIYDYQAFFAPLLDSGLDCTFIPYGRLFGDPFLQLIAAIGADPGLNYAQAASGSDNVQPGTRGVWLSRLVVEKLEALGFNGHNLKNTSQVVRRIAEHKGWHNERYYGFSEALAASTQAHYNAGNEIFARRVWNRSWHEVFPQSSTHVHVYAPKTPKETWAMEQLADRVVKQLAARNVKLAQALRKSA